jgi:POT family proton-dependent oligopeptide transporter
VWNTYNLWVRDHLNLTVAGWQMPVAWLQAFDSLAPMMTVPVLLLFWRRQAARGREPQDVTKLAVGCLLFGAALVWLAAAPLITPATSKVPLAWALAFHIFSNVGYVFFAPTAVALFARSAPTSVNAMMVGVYSISTFIGGTVSGRLGGLYERVTPVEFWLIHAAIVGAGGVAFLVCSAWLRRELQPRTA